VGLQHAVDAPAAYPMALRLHLGPRPARAVVLAVVGKRFANSHLTARFNHRLLAAIPPGVIRGRGHAQHLAELAHRHVSGAPRNVLVGAHRVGWPSLRLKQALTKAFFKISSSCSARLRRARRALTSGSRATSSLPTSATSCACCQRESSLGLMPNCRAAAWVLRLSDARRRASALNASSYLRHLSGDVPLFLAVITDEIYVLLLSGIPRPPQIGAHRQDGVFWGLLQSQH
jgi:hypothetical protein